MGLALAVMMVGVVAIVVMVVSTIVMVLVVTMRVVPVPGEMLVMMAVLGMAMIGDRAVAVLDPTIR
jgi:hypothetical protein